MPCRRGVFFAMTQTMAAEHRQGKNKKAQRPVDEPEIKGDLP